MSGIENDVLVAKNVNFDYTAVPPHNGIVTADGQLLIGSTTNPNIAIVANTLTAGTGITVTNGPGTITIASTAATTDLHVARFIVASSTTGTGANFTTIAAAITAAVATGINSTIFIQPGIYTENLTLPANINLCAFVCDAFTPNVTIVGTITKTTAGSSSISGIRFQTNSAALLAVTGSAASVINLDSCYLNCTNNTGITFSAASTSSAINMKNCKGDIGTTGIALFSHSSTGILSLNSSVFSNTGNSTTASIISSGTIDAKYSIFQNPITTSGTATISLNWVDIDCNAINTTALTHGGSGATSRAAKSIFLSGSASAVSIGATLTIDNCEINTSNIIAITGAGTLQLGNASFTGSSNTINTTTQTPLISRFGIQKSTTQPAFLAVASLQSDVTGDSTAYTILYANEIFDQNANYDPSTGIFTAPVTGRYQFNVTTALGGLALANTSGNITLVATSRSTNINANNWGVVMSSSNIFRGCGSMLIDMTATDTCKVVVAIFGGTKVVDVLATDTTFSGYLVC